MREEHYAGLEERKYLSIGDARPRKLCIDFSAHPRAGTPGLLGTRAYRNFPLADLVSFIDLNPFFATWQLRGKYPNRGYPKIFINDKVSAEARKLFDEAQGVLVEYITDEKLSAHGVRTIFPANSVNEDDIEIFVPDVGPNTASTEAFATLRTNAAAAGGERTRRSAVVGDARLNRAERTRHPRPRRHVRCRHLRRRQAHREVQGAAARQPHDHFRGDCPLASRSVRRKTASGRAHRPVLWFYAARTEEALTNDDLIKSECCASK